ncbi:glutathione S-transferase [Pseudomassariella vexata]|uniref:Glutathione S-transferase n=1 Tax=Pseudomassariella vexata TaxID=1141098 RepID=A0A1Y2EMQ3_9PEZI|nr:glutathione S-transferase [Pseudomassariella vexata]ORY72105.1 glutathione S-transferase [Pseudomassariella vexata]
MAEVDISLPAHPTGAAAKLAEAHSALRPLRLYGGWFCPFVQRSWIVLHEKRIPHQYVEINPYKKASDFLALNPRGLVPTLAVPVDPSGGGKEQKPLYESSIICEYLNEEYADEGKHGRNLFPESGYERARCRLWIDHISKNIIPGFYKWIQHTPEKEYSIEEARQEFFKNVLTLVKEMNADNEEQGGGSWFLGDRFSMVDVMLAPWAMRLFLIEHYKPGGLGMPAEGQGGEDEKLWGRWRRWFGATTERKSVKETWSEDEYYVRAYKRYAEDTTQSEVGQATRKGKKLP